jgi:predicted nucleic acid-binding protein
MPTAVSSESPSCVVDTVVLRYFLFAGEADLLIDLLGPPIGTPRIVYDPDEANDLPNDARSVLTYSVAYQRRVSDDTAQDPDVRQRHLVNAQRLGRIDDLHQRGRVVVLDLSANEFEMVGRLTSKTECEAFGLRFPLQHGEAACLAIAVARHLVLVTDDSDALRALASVAPGHQYERIRKLLIRAADTGLRTAAQANELHDEMRMLGFWDHDRPFPDC